MVTVPARPNRRRQAVTRLEDEFGVSQRRACTVVGQHRSTQRHPTPEPPPDEATIRGELRAFAKARPRWGWRQLNIYAVTASRSTTNAYGGYGAMKACGCRPRPGRSASPASVLMSERCH